MKFVSYIYKGNEGYGIVSKDNTKVIPMDILLKKTWKRSTWEFFLEFIRTYSDSLIPNLQEVINHNGNGTISLDNVKITAPIPYPRRNVFFA